MTIWYTARAAGLAALILLSVATAIGALGSGRSPGTATAPGRVVLQYVHRVAAALGLGMLTLHVTTILADSFAHVGVTGAVVPFTSSYRATWVGLGTIAAYTFVLVGALGFARGRMAASPRAAAAWRAAHCSAYAGWGLAVGHGFISGTDSDVGWVRVIYLACIGVVAAAVLARLVSLARPTALVRHRAATSALVTSGAPR